MNFFKANLIAVSLRKTYSVIAEIAQDFEFAVLVVEICAEPLCKSVASAAYDGVWTYFSKWYARSKPRIIKNVIRCAIIVRVLLVEVRPKSTSVKRTSDAVGVFAVRE